MKSKNTVRVDAYLDQVLAPLMGELSPFHRGELRRELRAHLWERVESYQELGQSEEDAVTEALRQFGGAKNFARQWRREWVTQGHLGATQEIRAAAWQALRLCVPALMITWGAARVLAWLVINCLPSTYLGALGIVYGDALFGVTGAVFFGLSLWAGVVQGRRAPRRSGLGMFGALSATIVAGSAFYWLGTGIGLDHTVFGDIFVSLPLMAAAWMPTACLAAAVSGWHAHRKRALI